MSALTLKRSDLGPANKVYCPHGAARELFLCKDAEILMEGPAGTGKSRAVLEKVYLCLMKYPRSRALIVRKTRASMTESVLVTFEEKVVPSGSPMIANQLRRVRQSYEFPNGSALVIGGMDNPDRIMSTEYDLIAAFESTELIEDDWEKLTTRLRNGVMPYQQAIADCNPAGPSHWLNGRANRGTMTRLLSRHTDNPMLWDMKAEKWTRQGEAYLTTLGRLTGARLSRLLNGRWASTEGAVYEQFDAATHIVDRFDVPKNWRRIRSIDFGLRNPFVCQWWAIDNDGRMYLYREIFMTGRLIEDHVPMIQQLSEGESYEASVSDHDLDDRNALRKAGIPTIAAYKSVTPGIQAVSVRLSKQADGKPRLMLMRGCRVERDPKLEAAKFPTCTEEEFDGYVYAPGQDGKPNKEEPVKLHDHGMDAMRYAVAYVDGLPDGPIDFIGAPTLIAG